MEEVKMYQTSGGKIVNDKKSASDDENLEEFEANSLSTLSDSVNQRSLYNWIIKNSDLVITTLKKAGKL